MARTATYRREEVVKKAMRAFWEHGYEATGMAEIVRITGLNPGSIYAAFQSKQDLFLAALDLYGDFNRASVERQLAKHSNPLDAIRDFFRQLAATVAGPSGKRSCFLVNSALEVARHDRAARKLIRANFQSIEASLLSTLERAQAEGHLSQGKDIHALAATLMVFIWGLRVLGTTGPTPEQTEPIVAQVLELLE
ncbi:MAG: TetR/AcrR family transcriptional regulator [Alphaproteobacteria bacterium]|nr:TetR/AcrR family transcriptional regulator [Alphaproteobacteria bacterium]